MVTSDVGTEHEAAVERALARRGQTLAEYLAVNGAEAEAEAAHDAEVAHWRRGASAPRLAETDSGEVRRGQWVEATAWVLATTRRRCHAVRPPLPYQEAEEMAADVLAAELEAGAEAGRRNHVRAERLTARYLGLTAQSWRARQEADRLSALSDDMEVDLEAEAAEVAPLAEAEADDNGAEADTWRTYREAAALARRLHLAADLPIVAALAQGLSDRPAADLAQAWGVGVAVWRRDAARGGREIKATYPNFLDLARRLLTDHLVTWRATPLAARRLGAKLPEVGRMRNVGQLAREADVLLARPALPGRRPTASKRTSGTWRTAAEAEAEVRPRTATPLDLAHGLRRLLAAKRAAEAPRTGARPHRAYQPPAGGHKWEALTPLAEAHGLGHLARRPGAAGRPADVLTYIGQAEHLIAAREAAQAAPQAAQAAPPRPRPRRVPTALAPQEGTVAGRTLYRPTTTYNDRHRYQTWRLVMAPPRRRQGMLIPGSLDTVTAAELEREAARPFTMTADRETD